MRLRYKFVLALNSFQYDTRGVTQSDTLPNVTAGRRKFYISPCSLLQKYLTNVCEESIVKMAASSKSQAISQMAYTRADGNFYAIWEMAYSMKGLILFFFKLADQSFY